MTVRVALSKTFSLPRQIEFYLRVMKANLESAYYLIAYLKSILYDFKAFHIFMEQFEDVTISSTTMSFSKRQNTMHIVRACNLL